MSFVSGSQFHVYLQWVNAYCLNSVLNVKALVGAFNQEKALVGAFSVIVKSSQNFVYPSIQAQILDGTINQ